MLSLARLIDRGPWWAAGVAVGLLFVGLVAPTALASTGGSPVVAMLASLLLMAGVVLSAASVAFVVLRRGESAIVRILLPCLVLLSGTSMLLLRTPLLFPVLAIVLWLPAILAAVVLRRTESLGMAVLVTALAGLLALLLMEVFTGGTMAFWTAQFAGMAAELDQAITRNADYAELFRGNPALVERLPEAMASMMTASSGMVAMSFGIAALFIGRYWQAALINPGGFQREFHALSLGRKVSLALALVLLSSVVVGGPTGGGVAMLVIMVFCLQGLSVAHAIVRERGMNGNWLVGLYLLLLIPHTTLLLAALGLLDNLHPLRQH